MKGMTSIVKNITSLIAGFVAIYGVYVVTTGHLTPGGGFAGGVILVAGGVMVILAFGGDRPRELIAEGECHIIEGLGALAFLVVAVVGYFTAAVFFKNFLPAGEVHKFFSGGTILISNIAIGTKVASALIGIFLALVLAARPRRRGLYEAGKIVPSDIGRGRES